MPKSLSAIAILLAALLLPSAATAAVIWQESVDGDLSGNPATPTQLVLSTGSNIVTGSVQAPNDIRDYVTFTIAADQQLIGLTLLQYQDLDTGGPGNRGYHALNIGATSLIPSGGNSGSFLGGDHLDPLPIGTDLLPILAAAPLAGSGFSTPLGAGTYSYLIQQTGPQFTGYSLDFRVRTVVPAPAVATLLPFGLLLLRRRTRRHRMPGRD